MIQIILLLGIGLIAGVVSSILGVGGGIILDPILMLLMKLEQHQAIGTSLAIIIPTVLFGAFCERQTTYFIPTTDHLKGC